MFHVGAIQSPFAGEMYIIRPTAPRAGPPVAPRARAVYHRGRGLRSFNLVGVEFSELAESGSSASSENSRLNDRSGSWKKATVRGVTGSENGCCFCGACVADLGVAPGFSARGVLCWSGETRRRRDGDRVALLASETPNGVGCRFPGTRSSLCGGSPGRFHSRRRSAHCRRCRLRHCRGSVRLESAYGRGAVSRAFALPRSAPDPEPRGVP